MRAGTCFSPPDLLYPTPNASDLAAVIPLVLIGTALLFPATTSLMSRHTDPRELGPLVSPRPSRTGLVVAPLLATIFQRFARGRSSLVGSLRRRRSRAADS
jgi:hypothetical protein